MTLSRYGQLSELRSFQPNFQTDATVKEPHVLAFCSTFATNHLQWKWAKGDGFASPNQRADGGGSCDTRSYRSSHFHFQTWSEEWRTLPPSTIHRVFCECDMFTTSRRQASFWNANFVETPLAGKTWKHICFSKILFNLHVVNYFRSRGMVSLMREPDSTTVQHGQNHRGQRRYCEQQLTSLRAKLMMKPPYFAIPNFPWFSLNSNASNSWVYTTTLKCMPTNWWANRQFSYNSSNFQYCNGRQGHAPSWIEPGV